jgi:hypothetical protein
MHSACTVLGLYCPLWAVRLYLIFPHYLMNGTIHGKKLWNKNVYFDFLYHFYLQHFPS